MSEKPKRNPQVTVVNTPDVQKKFQEQAKKKGLTVAAWLRMLGLQDIARNDF